MRKLTQWSRLAAVVALFGAVGCKSLEVVNPNAPDAARAFSDPGAVAGLITGAMRNWFNTRESYYGSLTLAGMADSYSASWNNAQLRFYTSVGPVGSGGADCPQRCGWDNTPSGVHRAPVETFWYGYYTVLSSVNDVLIAIRQNGVDLGGTAATKMHEAMAVMLQGVAFANIALDYDKGFVVNEVLADSLAKNLATPASLPYRPRKEVKDSAMAKFTQAITLLQASPFAQSPATWTGTVNGTRYSSAQIIQLIHTMQAELLADYPRCSTGCSVATDNANDPAIWAQVATFASQGISSGTPFTFQFFHVGGIVPLQDPGFPYDWPKAWGNAMGTMRVDTRVARLVTGGYPPALGPGPVYNDPYPNHPEPQPNSNDKRVGNGTWGPVDNYLNQQTKTENAGHGSDFAWAPREIFNPARGLYHRSSLAHIRYTYLAYGGSNGPGENGSGQAPFYTPTQNDLLWAEGLLRGGGSPITAANLINKTRVTRGGLTGLTGGEGQAVLLTALQYEQEVEEMGLGPVPFHNRRRGTPEGWAPPAACPSILCLWQQTPRQMPVPAKELSVLQQELYTFGGPGSHDVDVPPAPSYVMGEAVWSARQIGTALLRAQQPGERVRRRH